MGLGALMQTRSVTPHVSVRWKTSEHMETHSIYNKAERDTWNLTLHLCLIIFVWSIWYRLFGHET